MADRTNQKGTRSAESGRFEALLAKLVAVQLDLDSICEVGKERAQIVASLDAIADACDVLLSAIADVRNIIYEANGLTRRPEALYG